MLSRSKVHNRYVPLAWPQERPASSPSSRNPFAFRGGESRFSIETRYHTLNMAFRRSPLGKKSSFMIHSLLAVVIASTGLVGQVSEGSLSERVERSAREYRISIYESYHEQRSEYDSRTAVAQRVLDAWNDAGRPRTYSEELIQWFEAANDSQVVPPLPEHLTNLEQMARERAASRKVLVEATSTEKTKAIGQPVEEPKSKPEIKTKPEVKPPTPPSPLEAAGVDDSFLGGLSRTILRATINATDENGKQFE